MLPRCRALAAAACFIVLVRSVPMTAQEVLVRPYVQPGNGSSLEDADVKVLAWLTDQAPGDWSVEYRVDGNGPTRTVQPVRVALDFEPAKVTPKPEPKKAIDTKTKPKAAAQPENPKPDTTAPPEKEQHFFKYAATLAGLPFDSRVAYRVLLGSRAVREGSFPTRASAGRSVRFALVGDMAANRPPQNAVAWQISRAEPDFLLALGDIVYPSGRVNQYLAWFWKTYNDVDAAGPLTGAPLMARVPFYPVLGNHDVAATLPATPDAFGAYYFFHVPRNGPGAGVWATSPGKDAAVARRFQERVGPTWPALDFYSFDNGPAHVAVINANKSANASSPEVRAWLEKDLRASRARWKFVCFHQPPFHTSPQHYTEQAFRLMAPLFQDCGVDMVFSGHVHNYQRTVPLRFYPAREPRDKRGLVNGAFLMDASFDGEKDTRPDGVIYMVLGGGGASLYGPPERDKVTALLEGLHPGNWAPFNARYVADRHSFGIIDLEPERLLLRGLDQHGREIDRMVITKPRGKAASGS